MVIRITNQFTCEDVNACIEDIENSGGIVEAISFFHDDNYVDVTVDVPHETSFRSAFELTPTYANSNY